MKFQSTPSVGRATQYPAVLTDEVFEISIHALRGEGDNHRYPNFHKAQNFNPRPPWGGRPRIFLSTPSYCYFNPRPPWGGRPYLLKFSLNLFEFQSTPSVGRATHLNNNLIDNRHNFNPRPPWGGRHKAEERAKRKNKISIHALRGEGDVIVSVLYKVLGNFNPRPPWGGRPLVISSAVLVSTFQSTPSVGRATILMLRELMCIYISIHALRGEGDDF